MCIYVQGLIKISGTELIVGNILVREVYLGCVVQVADDICSGF
jgi:hypothetical protein